MPPPLHGLRALDLTGPLGFLCGRLLVDLGVSVIKVEPRGGDPGRGLAPRYRDGVGREHGLYWYATNAGKLGVTLDLDHAAAPRVLADVLPHVDFVLESFAPDSRAAALAPALLDHALTGTIATRDGNRTDHAAPHGAYPSNGDDRWLAISVRGDEEWAALCTVVGHPEWRDEPRFATHAARVAHGDALDAQLTDVTRGADAGDLAARLQAAGVAAGPVASALDLHADPVLASWGFFQWLEHPARPPASYAGHALRLDETPGRLRSAAPLLGEHTALVLGELLDMPAGEIDRLVAEQVAW